jgi:hypothetical protein
LPDDLSLLYSLVNQMGSAALTEMVIEHGDAASAGVAAPALKRWGGAESRGSGLLYAEQAGTASTFANEAPACWRERQDQRAGSPVTV